MNRRVFLAFMLFMGVWAAGAQTCTLRFTGTDKQQHYVKLDHVKIFNKTQLWQEVIYWPDTTLVLGGTGVEEYDIAKGFRIMQNTPNPFSGSTEFAITLPQERSVLIEIFDISGKKVISKSFGRLEAGTHIFNVTLQTPNTYIANATIKDGQMTIKMINEGHGAANEINYGGMRSLTEDYHTKGDRYVEAYPFASGDMMEYTGYASIGGTEYQSVTVQQKQYGSETISLRFHDGQPCSVTTLMSDYDGNVYNTVQIGKQCWMRENLRTTHYADGTAIALGSSKSSTTAYRYYSGSSNSVLTHGYLYNWAAVMHGATHSSANPSGVQGICPTGWHVPSDAEWSQLTDYVGSQSEYICGNNVTYIAKALAADTGWQHSYYVSSFCEVGYILSENNATNFSALPTGGNGGFGQSTTFWSTNSNYNEAYGITLSYNDAEVRHLMHLDKGSQCSVRCLRD